MRQAVALTREEDVAQVKSEAMLQMRQVWGASKPTVRLYACLSICPSKREAVPGQSPTSSLKRMCSDARQRRED